MNAALEAYASRLVTAIILTGAPSFILLAVKEVSKFVPEDRILVPDHFKDYTADTPGDILQAVRSARANLFQQLLIATEEPHFRYRVKPFLKELDPEIHAELLYSGDAEPWYWAKEFGSYILWRYMGGRDSSLYRGARSFWKFFREKKFLPKDG